MRIFLLLVAATAVAAQGTRRYPVSSPLPNNAAQGALISKQTTSNYKNFEDKDATLQTSFLKVHYDKWQNDMSEARLTMLNHNGYGYRENAGCIEARFWTLADVNGKTLIKDNTIIIFREEIPAADLKRFIKYRLRQGEKTVTLAFAKRFAPIPDEARELLQTYGIPFIQNIDFDNQFDTAKSDKVYYAFIYVIRPSYYGVSSSFQSIPSEKHRIIDLVDLLIFDADDNFAIFCNATTLKLYEISQKIKTEKFPIEKDIALPKWDDSNKDNWLEFSPYTATHIEAPSRFDKTKQNVSNLPEAAFFSRCVELKLNSTDGKPITKVTKKMLEDYDKTVKIPSEAILFINTDWAKNWDIAEEYQKNYPTVDLDAVKFLVDDRKAVVLGIDTLSFDAPQIYKAHSYMASKNVGALLNLNLNSFPEVDAKNSSQCIISYLRSADGTGAPAAVFVLPGLEQTKPVAIETKEEPKAKDVVKKLSNSAAYFAPSMTLLAIIGAYFL